MEHTSLINKLISNYRILDLIGKGGMGTVYRAMHAETGQMAAIKVLHHPGMSDRFINEAKLHARLRHPHIAKMYGYDLYDSRPCIIMELIDGHSLFEVLESEKRLSVKRSLKYFNQICSAVSWLHNQNIMYRDIKPENIKINSNDDIKLLDFGIAKSSFSPNLTQTGFTVGTIDYMAPEQLQGNPVKASDIWGLGVILYQMLSGLLPFGTDSYVSTQVKIISAKYNPVSQFIDSKWSNLDLLVSKCLKPFPEKRASCSQLIELSNQVEKLTRRSLHIGDLRINRKGENLIHKAFWLIPLILIIGILFRVGSNNSQDSGNTNNDEVGKVDSILIDVLNAKNARIVFPDNSTYPVPYMLIGQIEDNSKFKITAEGYKEKNVSINLDQRRKSYNYVLEEKRK